MVAIRRRRAILPHARNPVACTRHRTRRAPLRRPNDQRPTTRAILAEMHPATLVAMAASVATLSCNASAPPGNASAQPGYDAGAAEKPTEFRSVALAPAASSMDAPSIRVPRTSGTGATGAEIARRDASSCCFFIPILDGSTTSTVCTCIPPDAIWVDGGGSCCFFVPILDGSATSPACVCMPPGDPAAHPNGARRE